MLATNLPWYIARSSGMVAWLTCAAAVGWGLTLSSRLVQKRGAPAWLLASHRFLGLLSVVFVAVHLVGLWLDTYVPFGPAQLFIPMRATYKPLAVAWGIVAFYLLVAVEVSSLLMRHIPRKWWHRIHLSSLALLVLATVHGFTAGTDRANVGMRWLALVVSASLIFVATFRVLADRKAQRADRNAALAAARARQQESGEPVADAPAATRPAADRPRSPDRAAAIAAARAAVAEGRATGSPRTPRTPRPRTGAASSTTSTRGTDSAG